MTVIKRIILPLVLAAMLLYLTSCQQPGGNVTGSEYMPDMAHSIAYEANYYTYYGLNRWGTTEEYYQYAKPRLPVKGTIPRGYAGSSEAKHSATGISYTANGNVPYYYGDTEDERVRATKEIVNNPYHITDDGLLKGKDLYNVYCGICHGEKADGAGYLVRDANPSIGDAGGKYPVQPANLLLDDFINSSNGRFYHALMYGKNLMGAYKDKLSYEERWQVIHYIRSLQAKSKGLVYNQTENTLNAVDMPHGVDLVHTSDVTHEPSVDKVDKEDHSHH